MWTDSSSDLTSLVESPEAQKMLAMVTRSFYDNSRLGLWMFEALGREWDEMETWATALQSEIFPQTCTWSIGIWEVRYGIEPDETLSLETRRQQILAKMLYSAPINPESIRRAVLAITEAEEVTVEENTAPYTFEVTVQFKEETFSMVGVWEFLYRIKPSHLSFRLFFLREVEVAHDLHGGLHWGTFIESTLPELIEITEKDVVESYSSKEIP